MSKIYLAAAYNLAAQMQGYRKDLQAQGHEVTARWIDGMVGPWEDQGKVDANDLFIADTVIVFTRVPSTTGGYHVELGLAIAWGRPIVLVGPKNNVFHYMADHQYNTWEDLLMNVAAGLEVIL